MAALKLTNNINFSNPLSGFSSKGNTSMSSKLPWGNSINNSSFFPPLEIDPDRWDKLYPYRLLVVEMIKGVPYVVGGNINDIKSKTSLAKIASGLIMTQEVVSKQWCCTLPITPQQLSITDQFAIATTPTLRGVVEEHGGVRFKLISMKGTTGIWSQRPTISGELSPPTSFGSLAANTLSSISNLASSLGNIAQAVTGIRSNALDAVQPKYSNAGEYSTGYFMALYLQQFLERYAELKKNPNYSNWRLVLDIPKQNQSFIVSPISFTLSQTHNKPNEILFDIALKAWKRIDLTQGQKAKPINNYLPKMDVNTFQRVLATISAARNSLSLSTSLLKAVRGDWRNTLNALRQTALAIKDVAGFALTAADMGNQFIQDLNSQVINEWGSIGNSFQKPNNIKVTAFSNTSPSTYNTKQSSSSAKTGLTMAVAEDRINLNEGLSYEQVSNGALGLAAKDAQKSDSINDIFNSPEENFEALDAVDLSSLTLTDQQQDKLDKELEDARNLTVTNYRQFRKQVFDLMISITDNYGGGNSTYSHIYDLPEPTDRGIPMSLDENQILLDLMDVIQSYDLLIATKQWDDLLVENPLQYVGGVANNAGIDFDISSPGKYLVPVPYGKTIEEIAVKYLQDPNKWIEIVTLNKLKPPYIDEEGFEYSLLSNASGRQLTVNDTENLLYIGQSILLMADDVSLFSRTISDIIKISDDNYLVTVNGLADLDILTTANNARIRAYLPGTVNSQNQIYIPTALKPSTEDLKTYGNILIDNHTDLVNISKIDWLLTDNGDVALNASGDIRLAAGLTNLIQAIKMKLRTNRNTILHHLDYGLGIKVGMSVADIQNGDLLREFNRLIEADSRFDSINTMQLSLQGNKLSVYLAVSIASNNGILPINFEMRI